MGVNGIIIPEHSSAPITGSTANTSAGAIELLKFHISKNLNRTLEDLKKIGYWTYALDMKGKLINKNFKFDKKILNNVKEYKYESMVSDPKSFAEQLSSDLSLNFGEKTKNIINDKIINGIKVRFQKIQEKSLKYAEADTSIPEKSQQ